MRTLYLLRHAKSAWSDPSLDDADRPLAPRGERAAKRIAKELHRRKVRPELVLCSSSLRTRQTLAAIERSLGEDCLVELEPRLYAASAEALLTRLRAVPGPVRSVMLIGHNPGLQDLALALTSRGAALPELEAKFPTGALATLVLRSTDWASLSPGDAELVDYVVPRELG